MDTSPWDVFHEPSQNREKQSENPHEFHPPLESLELSDF